MNSLERHEHRYQRRKIQREQKKLERNQQLGTLEDIFTYNTLSGQARSAVTEYGGNEA